MPAVNLVPREFLDAIARRRRVRWWSLAATASLVVAAAAFGRLLVLDQLERRAARQVEELAAEAQDMAQRTAAASAALEQAAEQARAVFSLHREHPLPAQLLRLLADLPPGVVLDQLVAERGRLDRTGPVAAATPTSTPDADDSPTPLTLHVRGRAAGQTDIDELIRSIETLPLWRRVRLVRITKTDPRAGQATAFELECRPAEVQP